jgi:hypothetical protein
MKKITRVKHRWLLIAMVCFISLGAVSTAGCAGRTKTSTVTTQTTDGASGAGSSSSTTTQKEVTTSAHPRGVIGGIFYTLGQVLLFPFRVIGNLFS